MYYKRNNKSKQRDTNICVTNWLVIVCILYNTFTVNLFKRKPRKKQKKYKKSWNETPIPLSEARKRKIKKIRENVKQLIFFVGLGFGDSRDVVPIVDVIIFVDLHDSAF